MLRLSAESLVDFEVILIISHHDHYRGRSAFVVGTDRQPRRPIGRVEDLLPPEKPDLDKLSQLKLMLREKLETLDAEILDMCKGRRSGR